MTVWFENPRELFRSDKVLKFWPNEKQSKDDRINATTRFILYSSAVLYLIRRDIRILLLGMVIIGVLYVLDKNDIVKGGNPVSKCVEPTKDNPMGNVLLSDYMDNPNRPPACLSGINTFDFNIPYDAGRSRSSLPYVQQLAAARQFVTAPVSTIPGDQTAFAEWLYGKKNRPMCRDRSMYCDPNFRGAQLEAYGGLDPSGAHRGASLWNK
jgi:hypothetical protein